MNRRTLAALAICSIPLAAAGVASYADGEPSGERVVDWKAVDAVFSAYDRTSSPGCALGVVQDGELVYARGYGMANLEHGIAISPQTVFRTGSVAKQFTAAAIAIAAREGVISLDDPVKKWIPTLPDYPRDPTIGEMVHHTSGLRDYLTLMSLKGLRDDDFYTDADVLEVISRQRELNFTPGSEYLYSNSGYFLLGQIILEATGRSLREYGEEKIFGPLQMTHTHFHDDHNAVVSNRATGYAPEGDGYRISQTTLDMIGDGGVFTSIEDLVHWVNALNDDNLAEGLTPMLETRGVLNSGDTIAYAFGQTHGTYRGLRTVGHGGSFVGFRADITRLPDQSTSVMTICNRSDSNPTRLARGVVDALLADELTPPVVAVEGAAAVTPGAEPAPEGGPVTHSAEYAGSYYSAELDIDYVLSRNEVGGLSLQAGAGVHIELLDVGEDTVSAFGLTLRFVRGGGMVTGFEVDAGRVQHVAFLRQGSGS
jgi:CubicO group peptidase (beta-lactamase class C family)